MATNTGINNSIPKLIGVLFLIQMFAGVWLNFFFYKPLFANPVQLTDDKIQVMVGIGVLLAFTLSAINFAVCLLTRRALQGNCQNLFICTLSFTAMALCLTAMEGNRLSEFAAWIIYANSVGIDSASMAIEQSFFAEQIRHVVATGRNKTHFMAIFISSLSLLMFYSLLLRAGLLPRLLMYFSITACALQLIAVGHALFSQPIPMLLQLPLAINQLIIPIYLLIKGFDYLSEPASDRVSVKQTKSGI